MKNEVFIILVLCVESCYSMDQDVSVTYPSCSRTDFSFQGYTYTEQHGYKVWSHCNFYNPHTDPKLCGLNKVWQDVYICDPEEFLYSTKANTTTVHEIGDELQSWIETLKKDCPDKKSPTQSLVMAVVAVAALKTADSSANLCTNDCGELYPLRDDSASATTEDRRITASNFASSLVTEEWGIGLCNNYIVLLYTVQSNEMWAYAGAGTKEKFGEDVVEALFTDMQNIFNEKDSAAIGEVVLRSINLLTETLKEDMKILLPPAVILLLTFIGFLLLLLVSFGGAVTFIHYKDFEK